MRLLETTRLLLVEDDDGDAMLVTEMLHDVVPQMSVQRAHTIAEASADGLAGIGCVLLDLGLPDAHDVEAVERLRAVAADTPIVVLTGHDDEQRGIAALSAGAQDYLVKGRVDGPVLARVVRYAIERSLAEQAQRELLERRLQAQENSRLERALLPTALLQDPSLHVATTYRPGRHRAQLGGDFHDAVELPDGTLRTIIGDVCGHGPDEAALGACLRIAWRTLTLAQHSPPETLAVLEEMLVHERSAAMIFATACMVSVTPDRRRLIVYVAGHPPPIALDRETPHQLRIDSVRVPLGLSDGAAWVANEIELDEPTPLLLYTDGLVEGRVGNGHERLGVDGLLNLLRDYRPRLDRPEAGQELLERLISDVETLNGGGIADDVAMTLLSFS